MIDRAWKSARPALRTGHGLCAIVAVTLSAAAVAAEMPKRKPGLWETSMKAAQMQGRSVTAQQCVDEKSDADMFKRAMSNGGKNSNCSQQTSKRTANGWEFDAVCKSGNGTMTTHGVATGDFNSQYTMTMQSHHTPPLDGQSDFQTIISARHIGACPADMKPGDMKVNGMLIRDGMPANISPQQAEQMKKMMEQMKKQMKQQ